MASCLHLEVVIVLLLVPRRVLNKLGLNDVTELEDVVRRYGELAHVKVGDKDSFGRVDVDVPLVAVKFESMDFV